MFWKERKMNLNKNSKKNLKPINRKNHITTNNGKSNQRKLEKKKILHSLTLFILLLFPSKWILPFSPKPLLSHFRITVIPSSPKFFRARTSLPATRPSRSTILIFSALFTFAIVSFLFALSSFLSSGGYDYRCRSSDPRPVRVLWDRTGNLVVIYFQMKLIAFHFDFRRERLNLIINYNYVIFQLQILE